LKSKVIAGNEKGIREFESKAHPSPSSASINVDAQWR